MDRGEVVGSGGFGVVYVGELPPIQVRAASASFGSSLLRSRRSALGGARPKPGPALPPPLLSAARSKKGLVAVKFTMVLHVASFCSHYLLPPPSLPLSLSKGLVAVKCMRVDRALAKCAPNLLLLLSVFRARSGD